MRCLVFLLLTGWAGAQPLQKHSLTVRVDSEQVVANATQWKTEWGAFSKDLINARVLIIDIKQIGTGNGRVRVRWFFVGKDYDRGRLFIYDSGSSIGDVSAAGVKLAPSSRELVQNREKAPRIGASLTGQHPWGWVVVVDQEGRILNEIGSVPEMISWVKDEIAADPAKVRAVSTRKVHFISQAIADLRKLKNDQ